MNKPAPQKRGRGRPPKQVGARQDTRRALIRCGTEILTEKGFHVTGIDEVLKRVGVPKGSFYHYFASKEDFGLAVIDNYASYFAAKLDRWLEDEAVAPLQRMRNFVEDAKHGIERHHYRRGCLIGNLGQELGALSDTFRGPLEAVFLDWQRRVATCFRAAQSAGEIGASADPDHLAAFFCIGWEGAILRAKLVQGTEPLDLFADAFFAGLPRE